MVEAMIKNHLQIQVGSCAGHPRQLLFVGAIAAGVSQVVALDSLHGDHARRAQVWKWSRRHDGFVLFEHLSKLNQVSLLTFKI